MSRCLPYTPPVCARKAVNREALLEPIKLQRELEKKAKTHRKKEKKEKKKGKGHKKEEFICTYSTICEVKSDITGEVESNQLEKSDITDEHELPSFSENISYVSDGIQSSTKRKRTIIRIRSLPKRSDPQPSDASRVDPKADFRTKDLERTEIDHAHKQRSAETVVEFENAASTSGQNFSAAEKANASSEDHSRREGLLHERLIENWVQPLLQSVLNDYGDEEWLFETKQENRHGSKRFKATNELVPCCSSPMLWPQAHWLPEHGLCALPFTVPF